MMTKEELTEAAYDLTGGSLATLTVGNPNG
jgi:hypothetical protein